MPPLARKYDLPVWMTRGTQRMLRDDKLPCVHHFDGHSGFNVGVLKIQPFTVPHDACEPCQFAFEHEQLRLGVLTDTGRMTPHVLECLDGCDALLLECNHDVDMLADGPYPESLKSRVGGPLGHLSNVQAGRLLSQLDTSRLQHLVVAHLSDKNNHPALAQAALAGVLECEPDWIGVADQDEGLDWRTIA